MVQASNRSSVTAPAVKQDQPNGVEVVVPDGTPLTVITLEEISSKTASEGDALTFKVDDDVVVNGRVVIAKGTIAKGTVSEVQKSGHRRIEIIALRSDLSKPQQSTIRESS